MKDVGGWPEEGDFLRGIPVLKPDREGRRDTGSGEVKSAAREEIGEGRGTVSRGWELRVRN